MSTTVNTLVQASAEIVTILTLRKGDVYKRFSKRSYSETHTLVFGIVQTVDHNGTEALITALEFDVSSTGTPELAVYATGSELKLFAATPAEVETGFQALEKRVADSIQSKERELAKERRVLESIQDTIEFAHQLSSPETVQGQIVLEVQA